MLFETYYAGVYDQRMTDLSSSLHKFIVNVLSPTFEAAGDNLVFSVDAARVAHLVKSYFYDIIRYKEFHFSSSTGVQEDMHKDETEGGKYVNDAKQAAYIVKWIVRTKPISLVNEDEVPLSEDQEQFSIVMNEYFAYLFAQSIFGLVPDIENPSETDSFVYQLHYRNYDEGAFERIFASWTDE